MSAVGQLKSIIERILRLHAEEDEIKSDRREVYGEAKANGYDKTALGAAVALIRKRDRLGEDAIAERETIVGLYLDAYDNAPRAHTHTRARDDDHRAAPSLPERAPQSGFHGSDSEGGAAGESRVIQAGSEQESAVETQARNEPGSEDAASGGGGVKPAPETPFNLPIAKPLRPNCLNREGCGSYTAEHCFICRQALENTEAA